MSSLVESVLDDDIMSLFPEMSEEDATNIVVSDDCKSEGGECSTEINSPFSDTTSDVPPKSNDAAKETADLGERFWEWLKAGLADHSIVINDTKAIVHVVNGTYFLVSPGIFKRFSNAVLNEENQWKAVQKRFQKLGIHVTTQGQNIHKISVEGQNKTGTLMGYLIKDPQQVSQKIPPDNWVLTLLTTKGEGDESDV